MNQPKYIRPELLEAIARKVIKEYDPRLLIASETVFIPVEDIIEKLGLHLEFQYIRKNGRILGETVFEDEYIPLYNMNTGKYELVFMERGTIIIDASLLRCRDDGRLRFTCAHELAHWLIHQELYCGADNIAAMKKSISKSSESDKYTERQADMLGSAILLPLGQVKRAFYNACNTNCVESLAAQFKVSKQAMEIRLKEHRLIQ